LTDEDAAADSDYENDECNVINFVERNVRVTQQHGGQGRKEKGSWRGDQPL
jgi:hypothetical protein